MAILSLARLLLLTEVMYVNQGAHGAHPESVSVNDGATLVNILLDNLPTGGSGGPCISGETMNASPELYT